MGRSDDRTESDVERAVAMVEASMRSLGIDPAQARASSDARGHAFMLQRGSARIAIAVYEGDGNREPTLRVAAPVVKLPEPEARPRLYEQLLELNARELIGAAFGVVAGEVVVVSERALRDIDRSEVDALIRSVGRIADTWDDILAKQYATARASG
jgi:hypothetical protein